MEQDSKERPTDPMAQPGKVPETPRDFLREKGLLEAIKPLAAIVAQNREYSSVVEQTLELAMVIGFNAGERAQVVNTGVVEAMARKMAQTMAPRIVGAGRGWNQ